MTVDTHQHFWRFNEADFGWIGDDMANIRRNFLPADLKPILSSHNVGSTIAVQARQSLAETDWLLQLASENPFIVGVIGWVPLVEHIVSGTLARAAPDGKLVGVRHVIQGEPAGFMARDDFNAGIRALLPFNLAYDLLVLDHQLPEALPFVDRHPNQIFILDHFGKPRLDLDQLEPWRTNITELAKRPNVFCKISGGITEADLRWTPSRLLPYLDAVLEAFGANRLMFGSNWPVCEAAGGYGMWIDAIRSWTAALSKSERDMVLGGNAIRAYRVFDKQLNDLGQLRSD